MPTTKPDRDEVKRLPELCSEALMLILQLRATKEFGDPTLLRQRINDLFDRLKRNAIAMRIDNEAVEKARLALIAFIDETIISSDWGRKDTWLAYPLQMEHYNRFDLGEKFFADLEQLRQRTAANLDALEVYYLCLALGFRGKYGLLPGGVEKLRPLIEDLHLEMRRAMGKAADPLSPHGKPRDVITQVVRERVPAWVVGVAAAAIGFFFYLIMTYFISDHASRYKDLIDKIG